ADVIAKRRKTVAQFRQIGAVTGDCQMVGAIEIAQYVRQPENALGVVLDASEIKQAQRTAFILFGPIARQMNVPVQSVRDDQRARRIETVLADEIVAAAF